MRQKSRFVLFAACSVLASALEPLWAQQTSACDLDSNGVVNQADVTRAVNMALGTAPCTANVEGPQTCSVVTIQRVVNASFGQLCITSAGSGYVVALSWVASNSPGVAGYNVYRRTTPSGTPAKVNTTVVTGTSFIDASVQGSQTYYYSATSVDAAGNESVHSEQAAAAIPPVGR